MQMSDWRVYPKPTAAFRSHVLTKKMQSLVSEVVSSLKEIDAESLHVKKSMEKTMLGKVLFSPKALNTVLKTSLESKGWNAYRHKFRYEDDGHGSYEVDFLKNRVACEVQLGKYAFMSDNVLKLELFSTVLNLSDLGVLVVPSKDLQSKMSTGPGCFQQIVKRLDDLNYQHPLVVIGIKE